MGSSGSGKSTLLNCIAAVISPDGGEIFMKEKGIHTLKGAALADYRGKEVGYLFQNFELLDNLTGRENILLPLSLHGVPEKESRKRLQQLADYLGVERSALSAELGKMKKEGLVSFRKNEFTLP